MIAAMLLAAAAPLACGASTRPGIAELGEDGVWRGRAVELCRAVAGRVGGPGAPIVFHSYDRADGLQAAAADRIAFVTAEELAVVPGLRTGPVVARERQVLAVRPASRVKAPADLAGKLVCFIVGTRAEDALDAWAARAGVPVERLAFQEPVEMQDAFDVGKCAAEAVDAADLPSSPDARMLAVLDTTPILAATPTSSGKLWPATVAAELAP